MLVCSTDVSINNNLSPHSQLILIIICSKWFSDSLVLMPFIKNSKEGNFLKTENSYYLLCAFKSNYYRILNHNTTKFCVLE